MIRQRGIIYNIIETQRIYERICVMDKFENIIGASNMSRINDIINKQKKGQVVEEKKCKVGCIVGIIAVVAVVALAAYGLYKYLKPDYMDDFDDDYEDEFDEDFFEDEDDE